MTDAYWSPAGLAEIDLKLKVLKKEKSYEKFFEKLISNGLSGTYAFP